MAVDAEPDLLVRDLVALKLAVGVGGERFVDGDFGERRGFADCLHSDGDAADAGELEFGVGEFVSEEFLGVQFGALLGLSEKRFDRAPRGGRAGWAWSSTADSA